MSIFGWSLPPGCSSTPFDAECICQVCGMDVDSCPCPACLKCQACGDPKCYLPGKHGMIRTPEQVEALIARLAFDRQQAEADRAEGEYWAREAEIKREQVQP